MKKIRNEVIKFNFNGINIFSIFNKNMENNKQSQSINNVMNIVSRTRNIKN